MNSQQLSQETLTTVLCEIESILNNRPLTPISSDSADPGPITPNHLLNLGTDCVAMPFGLVNDGDSHSTKRWKLARYLSDVFLETVAGRVLTIAPGEASHVNQKASEHSDR